MIVQPPIRLLQRKTLPIDPKSALSLRGSFRAEEGRSICVLLTSLAAAIGLAAGSAAVALLMLACPAVTHVASGIVHPPASAETNSADRQTES